MRPQPGDAETTHPTTPPEFAQITEAPLAAGERSRAREAAAESALCRHAKWVAEGGAPASPGAGDGQLAGLLGLRRAARLGGARRGRRRGADAAGAQPRARALLHLRRPQHPAPLRRRQGPSRRTCEFSRGFSVSPPPILGQESFSLCRLSRCCWRKALTLTRATTAAR